MALTGNARAPAPSDDADWTVQAADSVERVVGAVRDKTAVPLTTVARAVVYGLVAAVMGVAALTLVAIGLVRAVNAYVPEDVWAAHLIVGGIFTLAGLLLLRKANAPKRER
ncbi:MAG TPA: hypothetical protein VHE80_11005 [Acidimicrobiales bacterium]|nr:hypothetical protein [Acidimicrobiales bacterium]